MLCVAETVAFTRECEEAISGGRGALNTLKTELMRRLGQYTSYESDVPLIGLKVPRYRRDIAEITASPS